MKINNFAKVTLSAAALASSLIFNVGATFADTTTTTTSTSASTSNDIFWNTHFDTSKLKNGAVLQQNPYVVVVTPTGLDNDTGGYVYVCEYVGKMLYGTSLLTYWKAEAVNVYTGKLMYIVPNITNYAVKNYPMMAPPTDGQGYDFGTSFPVNPQWATGGGLTVTPVPNWSPLVKPGGNLSGFNDVPDTDLNAPFITDLHNKGLINGTGDGNFSPNDPLTREQFAKMIVGAFQISVTNKSLPFSDVDPYGWSASYIATAYTAGVTVGTGDNMFSPTQPLTKEQAATMVWRWLKAHGVQQASDASSYDQDVANTTDDWAKEAVKNIMAYGFRSGGAGHAYYGSTDTMNRGEAAALIDLSMKKLLNQ